MLKLTGLTMSASPDTSVGQLTLTYFVNHCEAMPFSEGEELGRILYQKLVQLILSDSLISHVIGNILYHFLVTLSSIPFLQYDQMLPKLSNQRWWKYRLPRDALCEYLNWSSPSLGSSFPPATVVWDWCAGCHWGSQKASSSFEVQIDRKKRRCSVFQIQTSVLDCCWSTL